MISPRDYIDGKPDIATGIHGFEIMQKQVGDCSVLSSLAVCGHYEFKFRQQGRHLISKNIFPQDNQGNPVYNPAGHYVVKLFINGMWRAVHIDDYLPVNTNNDFLCAYSSRGKMWVSLIEKAYLKLHGGYEFMGSNSSRDLYVLTGWLPEKYKLQKQENRDLLWQKILKGYQNNDCLITIGTGSIEDEDSIGLVGCHAYGVLEIVEFNGLRMMLVKNPWGHFRYRGKYSVEDKQSWTPQLK